MHLPTELCQTDRKLPKSFSLSFRVRLHCRKKNQLEFQLVFYVEYSHLRAVLHVEEFTNYKKFQHFVSHLGARKHVTSTSPLLWLTCVLSRHLACVSVRLLTAIGLSSTSRVDRCHFIMNFRR